MTHAAQTKALKAQLGNKLFNEVKKEWMQSSAKGTLSLAGFYKAKRAKKLAEIDAMIESWMVA